MSQLLTPRTTLVWPLPEAQDPLQRRLWYWRAMYQLQKLWLPPLPVPPCESSPSSLSFIAILPTTQAIEP
jgi:hypothetical protein